MEINLQEMTIMIKGNTEDIFALAKKISTKNVSSVVEILNETNNGLPRILRTRALKMVLNEFVKIAKDLPITTELLHRLNWYTEYSDYQLNKLFNTLATTGDTRFHENACAEQYKISLWILVLVNAQNLNLNEDTIVKLTKLDDLHTQFKDFNDLLNGCLYDFDGSIDVIPELDFSRVMFKSSTVAELRDVASKYDINVPKRLNRAQLLETIIQRLKDDEKYDDGVFEKIKDMKVVSLQRFAKDNDIKASTELRKDAVIDFILKAVENGQTSLRTLPKLNLIILEEEKFEMKPEYIRDIDSRYYYEFDEDGEIVSKSDIDDLKGEIEKLRLEQEAERERLNLIKLEQEAQGAEKEELDEASTEDLYAERVKQLEEQIEMLNAKQNNDNELTANQEELLNRMLAEKIKEMLENKSNEQTQTETVVVETVVEEYIENADGSTDVDQSQQLQNANNDANNNQDDESVGQSDANDEVSEETAVVNGRQTTFSHHDNEVQEEQNAESVTEDNTSNDELAAKEAELAEKEAELFEKEQEKQAEIDAKEAELAAKEAELAETAAAKEAELFEKEQEKQAEINAKEAELAETAAAKEAELAQKEAELAETAAAKEAELAAKEAELVAKEAELQKEAEMQKEAEFQAREAELAQREAEMQREAELSQKEAELAQKEVEMHKELEYATKEAELAAREAELQREAELAAKEAGLAQKEADIEKQAELSQKEAELAAKEADLEKQAELAQKEAELAQKEAELAQKEANQVYGYQEVMYDEYGQPIAQDQEYYQETIVVEEYEEYDENPETVYSENIVQPANQVYSENIVQNEQPVYADEAVYQEAPVYSENIVQNEQPMYTDEVVYQEAPVYSENIVQNEQPMYSENIVQPENQVQSEEIVYQEAPVYSENIVYQEAPMYSENIVQPENQVYSEEIVYQEAPVYSENIVYQEAPVYSENIVYQEAPMYSENIVYQEQPIYSENIVYQEAPMYSENIVQPVNQVYSEEIVYQEAPMYSENIVYGQQPIYSENIVYQEQPIYSENIVYQEQPIYSENIVYGQQPMYQEQTVYSEQIEYAQQPMYQEQTVYSEQIEYAQQPMYQEQTVYSEQIEYAQHQNYPQQGYNQYQDPYGGSNIYAEQITPRVEETIDISQYDDPYQYLPPVESVEINQGRVDEVSFVSYADLNNYSQSIYEQSFEEDGLEKTYEEQSTTDIICPVSTPVNAEPTVSAEQTLILEQQAIIEEQRRLLDQEYLNSKEDSNINEVGLTEEQKTELNNQLQQEMMEKHNDYLEKVRVLEQQQIDLDKQINKLESDETTTVETTTTSEPAEMDERKSRYRQIEEAISALTATETSIVDNSGVPASSFDADHLNNLFESENTSNLNKEEVIDDNAGKLVEETDIVDTLDFVDVPTEITYDNVDESLLSKKQLAAKKQIAKLEKKKAKILNYRTMKDSKLVKQYNRNKVMRVVKIILFILALISIYLFVILGGVHAFNNPTTVINSGWSFDPASSFIAGNTKALDTISFGNGDAIVNAFGTVYEVIANFIIKLFNIQN